MDTEKEKTKNKKTSSKTNKNIGEFTGTDTSGKEGVVSRSKAETDMKNPEFESGREGREERDSETGPSTGGYGDQHDRKRTRESQRDQFDHDRDSAGYGNRNRYSDYDRGFRDGADHASRYYNQENWNNERRGYWGQGGNMGYSNEPRYGRYSGYEEMQPGVGNQYNRTYPFDNYGDADRGTSRSYPSMQAGYEDKNPYRNDLNDRFDTERNLNRPYGEESYHRNDRGERRGYRGNEHGSPYRERSENRGERGSGNYDRERHLRNEPMERERGDRDREW